MTVLFDTVTKIPVQSKKERVILYLLVFLATAITTVFAVWWLQPGNVAHNFQGPLRLIDLLLFAAVTYIVWHQILMELVSWDLSLSMKKASPMGPPPNWRVAFITAFVPEKEPYDMLKKTLKAMVQADYPHDTWVLDEGDDANVKKICKTFGAKHFSRKGIEKYHTLFGKFKTRTKAGNHNSWHDKHGQDYDFVAQLDVDFVPEKEFLTKTLGYFLDPKVAFVGTPQIYGNKSDSWIARGAAQQAYGFYGHMMKGLFGKDMTFLIGSNHVIRTQAHQAIDGYVGHIVEDHITGMHYYTHKYKSVYVAEALAVGEGPSTWDAYFNQQTRWAMGLIHILFRHSPKLSFKMHPIHTFNYLVMQQYYFYGLCQSLAVFLLFLYFVFGISSTNISLTPLLIFYGPVITVQIVLFVFLQRYTINPKEESGGLWAGRFLNIAVWPIYLLAFFSVLTRRKLIYAVTPKGEKSQKAAVSLSLFLPHFVLGTATAICLVAAVVFQRFSPLLLLFAAINTTAMYTFVAMAVFNNYQKSLVALQERFQKNLTTTWQTIVGRNSPRPGIIIHPFPK